MGLESTMKRVHIELCRPRVGFVFYSRKSVWVGWKMQMNKVFFLTLKHKKVLNIFRLELIQKESLKKFESTKLMKKKLT